MANLAASAVSIERSWNHVCSAGDLNPANLRTVSAKLTLTGQGGTSNKILASLFGLTEITMAHSAVSSADAVLGAMPSYDRTYLLLDANLDGTPADVSATVRVVLSGPEKLQ